MAERLVRSDDLDGTDNATPRFFEFDGVTYSIDLGASTFAAMSSALQPFLDAAEVVRGRPAWAQLRPSCRTVQDGSVREDSADVRRWARQNGYDVAATGRLARDLLSRYDARDEDEVSSRRSRRR